MGALGAFACQGGARADEVCDEFPEVHTNWTWRTPKCGPYYTFDEKDGFLRLFVPDALTAAGDFDTWAGADRAPSFQRTDMGDGDWVITTRLEFDVPPAGATYHAGLMVGFGPESDNFVLYFGEYGANGVLVIERTGARPVGTVPQPFTADLGPVSLQIEKVGDEYSFRHRNDDGLDWIDDGVMTTTDIGATMPVTRVGLLVKAWTAASPEVVADFDYFCLDVPDATLPSDPVEDPIPVTAGLTGVSCVKLPNGSVQVTWSTCDDATAPVTVSIAGETVATVNPPDNVATIAPPIPGGSIITVELSNGFGGPVLCAIAPVLADICDEFEEDSVASGDWELRAPAAGPTVSFEDNPGFLRFSVPATQTFDNWTPVDNAPTLQRYDMGETDWTITTRLEWPAEFGAPTNAHHVGLMFGYGYGPPDDAFNDVTYWGEYATPTQIRVERTSAAISPILTYEGAPVSFQIEKTGNTATFRHRIEDTDDWITDHQYQIQLPYPTNAAGSPPAGTPVSRVGLIIKTWSIGAVVADFDYFCLQVLDSPPVAQLSATPTFGSGPLEVQFSGAGSTDPSGGTLTYSWDFGDGMSGAGEDVAHTYTTPGPKTVVLTVTDDENNTGTASTLIQVSEDTSPWTFERIGETSAHGLASVDDSGDTPQYCLDVGGTGIAATFENGWFLDQAVTGDFICTARVLSGDVSVLNARVGVMARLTTETRSANAFMFVESLDDGLGFQYRSANNTVARKATAGPADPPFSAFPFWLRLERQGGTFIGFYSHDGTTFTEYSRQDIPNLDVETLLVGLAAASGSDTAPITFCAELSLGDEPPVGTPFHRGDADDNGELQLTDAVRILGFLFLGGASPTCMDAGDADDNGQLQLTDAVRILGFLFLGGAAPAPPGPPSEVCGVDPTDDDVLDCAQYTRC